MSMLHEITNQAPRNKRSQRKGRGESSGRGKTSGRGNKGSKARVGTYIRRGYEGGQTEIYKRFPKRGFSNHDFERRFHIVNIEDLARFNDGTTVDASALEEAGLIPDTKQPVKILGNGAMGKKLTVVAGWYSKAAHEKITSAGGTAQNLKGEEFAFPKPKKKFIPREGGAKGGKKKKDDAPTESAPPAAGAASATPEAPAPEASKPE